jgi:hypothetical protein
MTDEYLLKSGDILKVIHDESAQSPREDDNLGTIAAFHRRYSLSDKDIPFTSSDFGSWAEMETYIWNKLDACVVLPIYMYDHSGITINTVGFSCPWDSGQIGFIYVTKKKVRDEYSVKRINQVLIEKVTSNLVNEITTYDQYLTGDVYGYQVVKRVTCDEGHTHEDEIDSCWGFYGSDPETNGMLDTINDSLEKL